MLEAQSDAEGGRVHRDGLDEALDDLPFSLPIQCGPCVLKFKGFFNHRFG